MQLPFPIIETDNNVAAYCLCFRCNQTGHIAAHCPVAHCPVAHCPAPMLIPQFLHNIMNIWNKMNPADSSYVPDKSGWTVPQFIGIAQNMTTKYCQQSMPQIRPFLLTPVSILYEKNRNTDVEEKGKDKEEEKVVHEKVVHEKVVHEKVVNETAVNETAVNETAVHEKVGNTPDPLDVDTEKSRVITKNPVRQHIESNLPVKIVPSFPAHAVCFCNLCRKKNLAPEKWVQFMCGHGNCQDCISSILKNRMPFEDADSIKCFCCWKISHHIYLLNE